MFWKLILICLISTHMNVDSLKNGDVCAISDTSCKRQEKNMLCQKTVCSSPKFRISCGTDYCTKDKSSCEIVQNLKYEIDNLKSEKIKVALEILFHLPIKKYEYFLKNINKCPSSQKFKWTPSAVCLNGKICRFVQRLPIRLGGINYISKADCLCNGHFSVKCGG